VRRVLAIALAAGVLASCPTSAFVFNVTPQVGKLAAPLVCPDGSFSVSPSGRRRSHGYQCDARDVTFSASALTWLGLALALSAVVALVLAVRKRALQALGS